MEWKRIKTALILFLLAANALLVGLYLQRAHEANRIEAETASHLTALLGDRGVALDDNLAAACLLQSARPLYVQRDADTESAWARAWLGDASFSAPADQTYVYQSAEGTVTVNMDGSMMIERSAALPAAKDTAIENVRSLLGGFTGDRDPLLSSASDDTVIWSQSEDGLTVFNASLIVQCRNGAPQSASGTVLLGTLFWGEEDTTPSVSLPLLRYYAENSPAGAGERIEALTLGYLSSSLKNDIRRLWPVWRISTKNQVIYLDAYTGNKLSEE